MKTQICRCDRFCKSGLDSRFVQRKIAAKKHSARSRQRSFLRQEKYDLLPQKVWIGHTD